MTATPELSRRERKKLDVHRRIRRAAAQLFSAKGYDATTVDEIAELADVAKGTFFNYFPRKDALLADLGDELLQDVGEALGPPESWAGTGPEQISRLFLKLGERVQRDPQLFKVMIVENMRNFWLREEEDPGHLELRGLVRTLIQDSCGRGDIPAGIDVEVAIKLIEAAYVTTLVETLKRGAPLSTYRAELIAKMNIIFRGLGAEGIANPERVR